MAVRYTKELCNQLDNLTDNQRKICALLAYECFHHFRMGKKGASEGMLTASHAAALIKVPDDVIMAIKAGNIKYFTNLGKCSGLFCYEQDYDFDFYGSSKVEKVS